MGHMTRVLSLVDRCDTYKDGMAVANYISDTFLKGRTVTLSFDGIDSVPSSFINGAFISLMPTFSFLFIKSHLRVVNSTRQINNMIKQRFDFEVNRRHYLAA